MTRNLLTRLAELAERDLRTLTRNGVMSRELATAWLPRMEMYEDLGDDFRAAVLARFEPAEPLMVAGKDFLPALPPVVEHYEMSADKGGEGEPSGVTCCCGTEFDGFLNLTLARQALDYHIADRKPVTV